MIGPKKPFLFFVSDIVIGKLLAGNRCLCACCRMASAASYSVLEENQKIHISETKV